MRCAKKCCLRHSPGDCQPSDGDGFARDPSRFHALVLLLMAGTRICIIGNSHLAAFKQGWEYVRNEFPSVEVVFFGALSPELSTLEVCDGALIGSEGARSAFRTTSGGPDAIRDEYDCYVVCGARIAANILAELYQPHFSQDLLLQIVKAGVVRSIAIATVAKVRKISSKRIVLFPAAMPIEGLPIENFEQIEPRYAAEFARLYSRALKGVAKDHDIEVCEQPPETLASPLRTKAEFGRNAPRLGEFRGIAKHRENDPHHMNGDYGASAWRRFFASRITV